MPKGKPFSLLAHADKIRKTWQSGQRTIILEGRRFALQRQDHRWKDPNTQQMRKESWIVVNEIGNKTTGPTASIELVRGGNLRSNV